MNAVDFSGKPASYTRRGPVLSFFYKPDVCYYGGDGPDKIVVCEPLGKATVTGTSFAAPWITRKMAYLIHVMGLSIKTKERLDPKTGRGLRFGVVVTLREMNGKNRIDVYVKAEEEITFE